MCWMVGYVEEYQEGDQNSTQLVIDRATRILGGVKRKWSKTLQHPLCNWLLIGNFLLYFEVVVLITNEPTSWYLLQPLAANIHCGNNREGCSSGSFTSYQPLTFPLIHRHCQHCKEMIHSRLCNYILAAFAEVINRLSCKIWFLTPFLKLTPF